MAKVLNQNDIVNIVKQQTHNTNEIVNIVYNNDCCKHVSKKNS